MRPFLAVGESRGKKQIGDRPLSGGYSATRLWEWAGMCRDKFLEVFDTVNSDEFNPCEITRYRLVVLLGRKAERKLEDYYLHTTKLMRVPRSISLYTDDDTIKVLVLPHPSGRNRILNDKKVLNECVELLRVNIKEARSYTKKSKLYM